MPALAAIQQATLTVFIGDHRQTPGGLSKGRAAAANRRKLLQRPLGLRALDKPGDYLPPACMAELVKLCNICGEMNPYGLFCIGRSEFVFHLDGEIIRDG